MTHNIRAERAIPASADELWQTIRQMIGMEDWYPGLFPESQVLESEGKQPRRTCVMQDGSVLVERVLLRDDATQTFVYAIDTHPMPAQKVVGTIRIDDLGSGQSKVSWSADMVLDPASAEQKVGMVKKMYENGLAALEEHHK